MKKTLLAGAVALSTLASVGCSSIPQAALPSATSLSNTKPNVVIFYVDDLGWGDTATYGHPIVQTPNLDKLAADGIKYNQYYAPAPLCSPSRAGLLTGRTPYRTGIRSWIPDSQNVHIGWDEITLADMLKHEGYDTAITGKLHLNGGGHMKEHPQANDLGFDHAFVMPAGWQKNAKVEAVKSDGSLRSGPIYPDNFWLNGKPVGETSTFAGELVANEAINWLERQGGDKPFFLYVPFPEVHAPISSPQKFLDLYRDYITDFAKQDPYLFHWDWKGQPYRGPGEYYANITYMDTQMGRIIAKLKSMDEYEDTIIIFSSDNGPVTREARKPYELNLAGETGGLRGRKDNLFEGGIRVPMVMKYSQVIPEAVQSDEPVYGLDIVPTLSEMIGFSLPTDRPIDGVSFSATFRGKSIERDKPMIWTIDMPGQDDPINEYAIRDGDFKLIVDRAGEAKYLFNIEQDPYEVVNLIKNPQYQGTLDQLMVEYNVYRQDIENDPILNASEHE